LYGGEVTVQLIELSSRPFASSMQLPVLRSIIVILRYGNIVAGQR